MSMPFGLLEKQTDPIFHADAVQQFGNSAQNLVEDDTNDYIDQRSKVPSDLNHGQPNPIGSNPISGIHKGEK